ncbi:unnamed protein product [Polarella glacialis]|uniref:EF-hand domain-containing protein n=1 Tax=Polarella glacialis TaxID=89957 RepID=A0A813I709_POLGL|nr:unnamed protein product [Polarella glacialis]
MDTTNENRVSKFRFVQVMEELGFSEDAAALYMQLDEDGGGELTLAEISHSQNELWSNFRKWCVVTFSHGADEMLRRLAGPRSTIQKLEAISALQFFDGLCREGWDGAHEEVLFDAMSSDRQQLRNKDLRWLDYDARRHRRKVKAKLAAARAKHFDPEQKTDPKEHCKEHSGSTECHQAFRQTACRLVQPSVGNLMSTWLDVKGKGWKSEKFSIRSCMWGILDKDSSGSITLEEFDFRGAELLAQFSAFMKARFGTAAAAFAAIDHDNNLLLKEPEFRASVKNFGFAYPQRQLFRILDKENKRRLNEEDLLFLDRWKPREFLTATTNPAAAIEFRARLLAKYRNYLHAWRTVMDKENSNSCNWDEFKDACLTIGFKGDAAGAWRHFDSKMCGVISLNDIDQASNECLLALRRWADQEFGGVRSAFQLFDEDGSNEVTYIEFKRACRIYGFNGPVKQIFRALDVGQSGTLSLNEVAFLDGWEFPPVKTVDNEDIPPSPRSPRGAGPISCPSTDAATAGLLIVTGDTENLDGLWPEGDLHPAFRSWANARRKQPVKKADGSLPVLHSQANLGDPRMFRRPVLLMAPVPPMALAAKKAGPTLTTPTTTITTTTTPTTTTTTTWQQRRPAQPHFNPCLVVVVAVAVVVVGVVVVVVVLCRGQFRLLR